MPDERYDDALIAQVAAALREPPAPMPAARARVMSAVRAAESPRRQGGLVRWLVRPRLVRVQPIGALAAAAIVIAVIAGRELRTAPTRAPAAVPAASAGAQRVQFVYVARRATSVALVGDFNAWNRDTTPLKPAAAGVWSVEVAIPPGRHEYAFIIDGRTWVSDPTAASAPADEFGSSNSVVLIGKGGS
ncbi:MAG: isoamylase early set domain-containing protein [Gemmatimonadaceae bacterium]